MTWQAGLGAVLLTCVLSAAQAATLIPGATEARCFVEDYGPADESDYVLPYAPGTGHTVINGNCGRLTTHREVCTIGFFVCGEDGRFAYDFSMPLETPVLAARAGRVIAVVESSATVRGEPPNLLDVRHADGTVARYFLLARDGALVTVGQQVSQGQVIARSGNSGAEGGGAHLHFAVFANSAMTRTIPVSFSNAQPADVPLIEDRFYQAVSPSAGAAELAAALLPTSRSVQIGQEAGVFASMVNSGDADASNCRVEPAITVPAIFRYQTADAANNLTGEANTPVAIAAGSVQNFVLGFTPTEAFAPTEIEFNFVCDDVQPAPVTQGLNSLLLSAAAAPVADIVALTTVVDLVAPVDVNTLFAVASVNVGSIGDITVTPVAGDLPIVLSICVTDMGGACSGSPAESVSVSYGEDTTMAFAVFVTATDAIPNNPAEHRIGMRFSDGGGVIRGATSTAVRTE